LWRLYVALDSILLAVLVVSFAVAASACADATGPQHACDVTAEHLPLSCACEVGKSG